MHWVLCRLRNAWTKVEWWCAPRRSDERRSFGAERGRITSLPPLSLSHLTISCTWTDARTCLFNLRSESHSSHRARCPVHAFAVLHGDIWTQFPSARSLRDGIMGGEKQQFINEQTLGSFRGNVQSWQEGEQPFCPLFSVLMLQFQVFNVYSVDRSDPISPQCQNYPKLTGNRWPEHPPYHFPWTVRCIGKRPHGHMSQMNIFFPSLLNKSSVIKTMIDSYYEKLCWFSRICVTQQTIVTCRLFQKRWKVNLALCLMGSPGRCSSERVMSYLL